MSTQLTLNFTVIEKPSIEERQQAVTKLFTHAIADYIHLVRRRAFNRRELNRASNGNLFTASEQDHFLTLYKKLWNMHGKVEAYALLRLVFANLRTDQLLDLLNAHQLTTEAALKQEGRTNA